MRGVKDGRTLKMHACFVHVRKGVHQLTHQFQQRTKETVNKLSIFKQQKKERKNLKVKFTNYKY